MICLQDENDLNRDANLTWLQTYYLDKRNEKCWPTGDKTHERIPFYIMYLFTTLEQLN